MSSDINNVVILGGGTAGWITACILAKQLNCTKNSKVTITVIESPDIPTIGVGEGTVPTMRQTLQLIGVSETDFIRECDVTFKQSIKFVDWLHAPTENSSHSYHHLFNFPLTPGFDLTPYWLLGAKNKSYAESLSVQTVACDNKLAPKKITHKEYEAPLEYAYHLDASKFSLFLAKHGVEKLNIIHTQGTVADVELDEHGSINALITENSERITGDFFVDCSGFSSRLLAKALNVGFVDKSHQLLVDTAIAMQVPYEDQEKEIPPYTIATAKEAGWIWDIGLNKRRGVGYVFSSKHTTHEEAEKTLRSYVGREAEGIKARIIPMKIGYREKFWHKNCVAIGLSAGFVEPLEATALLTVEAMAKLLAEKLPQDTSGLAYAEKAFNDISKYAWERVIDFIKLHYFLSKRTDSQFWLDNTNRDTVPETLLAKLDFWEKNLPSPADFFSKYEIFQLENYQYVLYGMNFVSQLQQVSDRYPHHDKASAEIKKIQNYSDRIKIQFGSHRELINKIKEFGLNKI